MGLSVGRLDADGSVVACHLSGVSREAGAPRMMGGAEDPAVALPQRGMNYDDPSGGVMRYEFVLAERIPETARAAFPELEKSDVLVAQTGTVLYGPVTDQPHLHGLLDRFQDLGLTVVEMRQLPD